MTDTNHLSRRDFLTVAAVAGGSSACQRSEPPRERRALTELSAVEAVEAMRRGEVSAEVYAQALLDRCEAAKHLNAFITLERERVLEAARAADKHRASGATLGALHGLPIPVKDSVNTKDLPTTAGTPALRGFHPREDAPVVRTLMNAGALLLGKTNIHELSFGWTSNNLAFGAVRNPYDAQRIPGGSTGGTAAAVAARMAPLGVAEDTEGSIRVPAALCGIAGFRPTTGRYPSSGVAPITPLFDSIGPHARTVADLALFDKVVTGDAKPLDPLPLRGVKLGVPRQYYYADLEPGVERVIADSLAKLRDAGVEFVEAEVPDLARLIGLTTAPIQLHDVRPGLIRWLSDSGATIGFDELMAKASDDVRGTFNRFVMSGAPNVISEDAYRAAVEVHLPALREVFRRYFTETGVTAMVFPTTQIAATPIGQRQVEIAGKTLAFESAISRNIAPGSTTGLPGLVLPAGLADGLPIGIEFDGPAGADRNMLALGLALERVLGAIAPPTI